MGKAKILISDKLSNQGIDMLKTAGFDVDVKTGLPEEEIVKIISQYDAMIVRSETKVTAKVIEAANQMKIIGRAGVGVDNIDVPAATKKGIIVVNSPEGNTIAAAEHSFAMLMSMARNIPYAHNSIQAGEWNRSQFTGIELYGKKIGVVGLGKIGRKVVGYAQGLGMSVLGYDPYVNEEYAEQLGIKLMALDELLASADFITFHIPKTKETTNLIDSAKFKLMKDGVYIINCARGGIIVEEDLKIAVESGKVRAAAIDVFSVEPVKGDNVLLGVKNIITTPHLGAVTTEAQENVAIDVADQIRDVLNGGQARAAVNIPSLKPELIEPVRPLMSVAEKIGHFIGSMIVDESIEDVSIDYRGDVAGKDASPLKLALLKGLLNFLEPGQVNFVNAEIIAKDRGITLSEVKNSQSETYKNLITLTVKTKKGSYSVGGTFYDHIGDMIVMLNNQKVQMSPEGILLIVPNDDKPGIIGKIGSLLGENNINIASMQVGREKKGGNAVMVVSVDQNIDEKLITKIEKLTEIRGRVKLVSFL